MAKLKILVTAAGFTALSVLFINYYALSSNKDISSHNLQKINKSSTFTAALKTTAAIKQQDNTHKVYDILGFSNKLTKKQWDAMAASRKETVALVEKNPNSIFINGNPEIKKISLTFDDGPDYTSTPKVLAILKKYNVNASFFMIGQNIKGKESLVKEAYNEGNLVLNHSLTHPEFTKLKDETVKKEIIDTENIIFSVIGKRPAILRPPYGEVSQHTINLIGSLNYKSVLWSTDTLDWSQRERENIVNNVLNNVRPGEIILMHTGPAEKATVEALPLIIDGLQKKGYEITTVDKLLNIPAYK